MAGRFLTSAAGGGIMGFLTKGIGSKLIFYVVILYAWTQLLEFVGEMIPEMDADFFDGLPSAVLWGLNYFDIAFLLGSILSGYAVAFVVGLRKG